MKLKNTIIELGQVCLLVIEKSDGTPYKFIFDTDHIEEVKKYTWSVKKASVQGKYYAVSQSLGKQVSLHQLVTGFKYPLVDHADRDTFDNRIVNLRASSKSLNSANSVVSYREIPRGVIKTPQGRFQSRVVKDKKVIHLGTFDTKEEAHEVYKQKHLELFKQHSIYYKGN
jgi:hypothetical protein